MTKQAMIYYYLDDNTRIVYWTETEQEDRHDLILLGQSDNQNKKMALALMTKDQPDPSNWRLREL